MRLRTRVICTAVVAVLGATGAGVAAQQSETTRNDGLVMIAEFADASPLLVGNEVKVQGAPVGEVAAMDAENGVARVTLRIDSAGLPVHQDARATIRPVSLLGERFVDLDRGSASAPVLPQGGAIPVSQTVTNTDLDQILNSIDDPTGESLAMLVTTLGDGLQGNGANADASIRALTPALTDTDAFASVLRDQNDLLNGLVDKVTPVAEALAADDGKKLDAVVASADQVLKATADKQQQLDATIAELPAAFTSARTTLDHVTGTADATTPTLSGLRPTTDQLVAISHELEQFSDSLDPALATARPVLDRGRELLDAARPVVADLRRAGPDLRATAAGARPLVEDLSANLDNVYNFIRFWAMTTNGSDGLSHYFRSITVVNPDSVTGMLPEGLVPQLPDPTQLAAPLQGPADAVGEAAAPLQNAPLPDTGLLAPPSAEPDAGATGLDREQESGMVDYLLGGGR
ncbi:mce related protein [Pseudonocardia autotrophica]|nr:mce related protein [Pseudonocardia autotrophica]